jgi:hypothetical protein
MAENRQYRKRPGRWRTKTVRSPKNRRRISPILMLVRGAMVALAAQGLWIVFHSPRLAVRRVDVIGADRLGAERVRHLASIPLGQNIFCINLFRARVKVESDPLVAAAEISRALPNAIRVLVKERRPVFDVSQQGHLFEADGEGVLFRCISRPTPGMPILALKDVLPLSIGQRVPESLMKPALACLRLAAGDRAVLWKINVDGPHELCLNMKVPSRSHPNGVAFAIRVGRSEDLALKLADARKVLAGRPQILEEAQYLNVSCAGRPVYLAKATPGAASIATRGNISRSLPPPGAPPHP